MIKKADVVNGHDCMLLYKHCNCLSPDFLKTCSTYMRRNAAVYQYTCIYIYLYIYMCGYTGT